MLHRFGLFELDEDARSLTLQGTPQKLQPRVFDLLVYLVRNAGRVVPKDELMDVLWPDLTVTESSLQRAVSLARSALAKGDLEKAIRSFVRHGYRFAIDTPVLGVAEPPQLATSVDVATARQLARELDWSAATAQFASIDQARGLEPGDLELWAFSVECRGRPVDAIPILERTISAYVAAGLLDKASRSATTLAKIHLERGAAEVAVGWLERAESLLEAGDDDYAEAYLLWMKSRVASSGGLPEEALDLASRAYAMAEKNGNEGLRAVTLVYSGFYNLSLGRIVEGNRQQNHAAAISLSGKLDPIAGSLVYCNILWSCRTFADWTRALQWSDGFESWCEASFAEHPGSCDLHRAEIVGTQKNLANALERINIGLAKLADEQSWSQGEGFRIRGDIHAMAGDLEAARSDYAQAYAMGWDAEPGNAVLLFEGGDMIGALATLERALQGQSWFHLQRRGYLMAHRARIAALGGHAELASQILDELEATPDRWSQPSVRALIAETRAALCGDEDPHTIRMLVLARQLWTSARMDFHAARVRLTIADALYRSKDHVGAEAELNAVDQIAARIGSSRLVTRAGELRALFTRKPAVKDVRKSEPTAFANRSPRDQRKIRSQ